MKKTRILLLCQHFPPLNHTASQRNQAYFRYLNGQDFQLDVLTCQQGPVEEGVHRFSRSKPGFFEVKAYFKKGSFLSDKFRSLVNKLSFFLRCDSEPSLTKDFVSHALKRMQETSYDVVISSFGPMATLIAGLEVKRKFPQTYWVVDMRDELHNSPANSLLKRKRLFHLEKEIVNSANLVISVSAPLVQAFSKLASKDSLTGFLEIKNGSELTPEKANKPFSKNKIKIGYFGTLYGKRKPDTLFKALLRFKKAKGINPFEVHFFGISSFKECPEALREVVKFHDIVPYESVKNHMLDCDALLLIHPQLGVEGVLTSKIFDYLFINRPIVGLVPPQDVAAQLIRDSQAGYVSALEDVEGIFDLLKQLYSDFENDRHLKREWSFIEQFSRQKQVEFLSVHLQEALKKTSS